LSYGDLCQLVRNDNPPEWMEAISQSPGRGQCYVAVGQVSML